MRAPVVVSMVLAGVLVWQVTTGASPDVTASIDTRTEVASPSIGATTAPSSTPAEPSPVFAPTADDFAVVADVEKVEAVMASRVTVPVAASVPDSGGVVAVDAPGVHSPIRVDSSIAGNLALLIAHAESDGIILGGWGWRSHQKQIELRGDHCAKNPKKPTQWEIWEKPSSSCRPPTARPGRSNHETGLAIDFTVNGR